MEQKISDSTIKKLKKLSKIEMRNEFDVLEKLALKNMKHEAEQIFLNMKFLDKFNKKVVTQIEQEIRQQLSEKGIRKTISLLISDITTQHLKPVIKLTIEETLKTMNTDLKRQAQITKELCQSIDSNIKHTLMKSPISYESEKAVINLLKNTINNVAQKKIMELGITKKG